MWECLAFGHLGNGGNWYSSCETRNVHAVSQTVFPMIVLACCGVLGCNCCVIVSAVPSL